MLLRYLVLSKHAFLFSTSTKVRSRLEDGSETPASGLMKCQDACGAPSTRTTRKRRHESAAATSILQHFEAFH